MVLDRYMTFVTRRAQHTWFFRLGMLGAILFLAQMGHLSSLASEHELSEIPFISHSKPCTTHPFAITTEKHLLQQQWMIERLSGLLPRRRNNVETRTPGKKQDIPVFWQLPVKDGTENIHKAARVITPCVRTRKFVKKLSFWIKCRSRQWNTVAVAAKK